MIDINSARIAVMLDRTRSSMVASAGNESVCGSTILRRRGAAAYQETA